MEKKQQQQPQEEGQKGNFQRCDYTHCSRQLQTRAARERQKTREFEAAAQTGGLSAKQFWKERVHRREDVEQYFRLYHPEYSDEVAKAMALMFQKVVDTNGKGVEKDTLNRLLGKDKLTALKEEQIWDYKKDMEEEKWKGLIKNQERRLEELLKEADDEEERDGYGKKANKH